VGSRHEAPHACKASQMCGAPHACAALHACEAPRPRPRPLRIALVLAAAALFLLAALGVAGAWPTPAAASGTISGMVTDASTGAGLPAVSVRLTRLVPGEDPNMPWQWAGEESTTGSGPDDSPPYWPDGWFSFTVQPGRYRLEFYDTTGEYIHEWWKHKGGSTTADSIYLADGATFDAGMALTPGAHIRGRVTDRAGTPLEGIYVNVHAGNWSTSETWSEDETAADGTYDLGGLPTDRFVVEFQDLKDDIYLYQFWPDKRVCSEATPIAVTAGQTTTLNAVMKRAASINGRVTTLGGVTLRNITVSAQKRDAKGRLVTVVGSGGAVGDDGSYRIRGVPAGSYLLQYRWYDEGYDFPRKAMWYPGTFYVSQARRVRVAEGQYLEGVDMTLWGDALPPLTQAPSAVRARRGAVARIRYRVRDARSGGPTADVTIKVKDLKGRTVKTIRMSRRRVNRWLTCRFRCNLKRKKYRYIVYAVDSGANRQKKAGRNLLLVK